MYENRAVNEYAVSRISDRPTDGLNGIFSDPTRDFSKHRLLSGLSTDTLRRLELLMANVPLRRGQVLQDHGHSNQFAYFVVAGLTSVTMNDGTSGPVEVMTVGPDDFLGLPQALGITKSPYRTIVQVPGNAFRIAASELDDLLARDPDFNGAVFGALGSVLLHSSQLVACNARHSMKQRLTRWLLTTSDQIRSERIDVTHGTIAQAIGVRRAGVTTELGHLENEKAIQATRGNIALKDRERLEHISCDCYRSIKAARRRAFA